jgi:hypothetical protein
VHADRHGLDLKPGGDRFDPKSIRQRIKVFPFSWSEVRQDRAADQSPAEREKHRFDMGQ